MKRMKHVFIFLLCIIFGLNILTGCEIRYLNDPEGKDPPSSSEQNDPSEPDKPKDPDDSDKSDEPDAPDEPKEPTEPTEPDEPAKPDDPNEPDEPVDTAEKEKYSYRPQIFSKIPRFCIFTISGDDDFITRSVHDEGNADNVGYVAADVTIYNGNAKLLPIVRAEVKAENNGTLDYEKKSVNICFDQEQSLIGLNGGKKFRNWVLLAGYEDLSSLNNAAALYLGKTILGSDGYYSSDFCMTELYVNGQYWGVYLLAEQQEAVEGRANASEAGDAETGTDVGYLMEYDSSYMGKAESSDGDPAFTVDYGGTLKKQNGAVYTPWQTGFTVKSELRGEAQLSFLKSYVENAFRILRAAAYENRSLRFNDDYTGTLPASCTPQEAVEAVIDLPSLADAYLLQEIICDPDIAWSNLYLSLDMREDGEKKLVFEAPWGFDRAFGIKWGFTNPNGIYAANSENPWLNVLSQTDFFQQLVKDKWAKLRKYNVFEGALMLIKQHTDAYGEDFASELSRWPNRLQGFDGLSYECNCLKTQKAAADRLYQWLYLRFNYLDSVFGNARDVLTDKPLDDAAPERPSAEKHRFEAENCVYDPTIVWDSAFRGASGGAYLGQLQQDHGTARLVTLQIRSSAETDAYLSIGLGKRTFAADFSDWFSVFVNGKRIFLPPRPIDACGQNEKDLAAWTAVDLGYIHLTQGMNTIVLNMVSSVATNLDYFDLYCDAQLT